MSLQREQTPAVCIVGRNAPCGGRRKEWVKDEEAEIENP